MTYFQQLDETDCGAACLAMIASHYKLHKSITAIRHKAGTDTEGTNLAGMVNAAENMEFEVKPMESKDKEIGPYLPTPFIAHMEIPKGGMLVNHYVVVRKVTKDKVYIWDPDPMAKKLKHSHEKFKEFWTGFVLFLSPGEKFKPDKKSKNTLLKFLPLLKPHTKTLVVSGVASLILVLLGIISSLYFRYVVDELLFSKARMSLSALSVGMLFILVFQALLEVSRGMLLGHFSIKADLQLIFSYFSHILKLPISFYDSRKTGEILSRLGDAQTIRGALSGTVMSVIMDSLMIIVIGPVLYFMNSTLFFILLITVPLTSIMFFIFSRIYRRRYQQQKILGEQLQSFLVESVNGHVTVKSLNAQQQVFDQYEKRTMQNIWLSWKTQKLGMLQGFLSSIVTGGGNTLLFWLGSLYIMDDVFTIGTLISFTALSGYFLGPLERLINLQSSLQEAFVSADRLGEILELELEQKEDEILLKPKSFKGQIKMENVLFRYGSRRPLYKDLNIDIPAGSWAAFVGPSGSGKTTLIKLLLKMYSPEEGTVMIDDYNLRDLDANHLRSRVGYVPQDIFLFSGTIAENITVHKPETTMDEIIEAAKGTGAHDFISDLPDRYNTKIGERGARLSGGERQRIALTRAVLGKPEIIIFDEATSNLDSLSEHQIHETINSFKDKKITTIIIAHRLTTVVNCDCIFVMDKGRIVQRGSHKQLLTKDGLYKSLWKGTTI